MRDAKEKQKRLRIFDRQAAVYDRNRDKGVLADWRRRLLAHARGHVLEAAVGAGANFPCYPPEVERVTAVDFSGEMLKYARRAAERRNFDCSFIEADLEEIDFPPASFDCIVSTLSLCTYARPERMLRRMNRWCRPGGQILLLEHGLGSNPLVRLLQHAADPVNLRMAGCRLNRDIDGLLAASGLKVIEQDRRWLGVFRLIRAEPGPLSPDPS
jgi:ubiquinone/menaquinone biosynthesis C-methylase UbiE